MNCKHGLLQKGGPLNCAVKWVHEYVDWPNILKFLIVGSTGKAERAKREKFARGRWNCPSASQNLAGTHAKGRARGKQGAMPPRAQTLRSILDAARSREEAVVCGWAKERTSKDLRRMGFPVFTRYWYPSTRKNTNNPFPFLLNIPPFPRRGA